MRMYGYVWLCRVMHGYAYNFDQRFTIKRLGGQVSKTAKHAR